MNIDWKDPNIAIGGVAEGNQFFRRDDLVKKIWDKLKNGSSVQLTAPRRVGKTSIMQFMVKQPTENYKMIFNNIESIRSANDFYERIYTLLLNCLNSMDKAEKWGKTFFKSRSIKKIGLKGIEWDIKPKDFFNETDLLLREINDKPEIENIVLFLDEIPMMLFNINKINNNEATNILHKLREWRQQYQVNKKVKYVLAGSVGIHYVVSMIEGRSTVINDLEPEKFEPLTNDEAVAYIKWATDNSSLFIDPPLITYLLSRIQYFVPYFINLTLNELNQQAKKINNPEISEQDIDNAFDNIIKENKNFDDWKQRLRLYLSDADFKFVNDILIHAAHKGHISKQEIYHYAIKHDKTDDCDMFMTDLKNDGYLVEMNDQYRFISPFLREYWKRTSFFRNL